MYLFQSFTWPALRRLPPCALTLCAAAISPVTMALTLSGSPFTQLQTGEPFWFEPVTDSSSSAVVFSVSNKPSWATFDSRTGRLSGTPGSAAVGYYGNIRISASDGTSVATLPDFFIHVWAADPGPPVISGLPPSRVMAGSLYTFQPRVSNPTGHTLRFGIQNQPAWATFNTNTGLLTGTPSNAEAGTYSNIAIFATDGQTAGLTSAFSITVEPSNSGTATLYWTEPTQFTDGAALTDLAGYRLYYGKSPSVLSSVVQLPDASLSTYTLRNLGTATWYFGIKTYTSTGAESRISQIVSKSVN